MAKCFYLIRSSSGPPRKQIQELFYVSLHSGITDTSGRHVSTL